MQKVITIPEYPYLNANINNMFKLGDEYYFNH